MSSQYFPPYESTNNIKVELDLANYATKDDAKNITHVDVSSYATKTNLEVDKIDVDKLKTVPVDLAKLSNVVKNAVKKTDYNTKVTSIENQIAGVTKNTLDNLADITKLKAVDTNNFVLKTKPASDVTTLENKINAVDKKIPKLKDQSYLVYNCKMGSFSFAANRISAWKLAGIFNYVDNSNMNAVGDTSGNSRDLKNDGRMRVYLSGNYFKQDKTRIPNNNNAINIYCVYQIEPISSGRDDTFTVQNALFGAMQITKNADTSKYKYKGHGICFDEGGTFGKGNINNGRNVLIFGVHENSLVHDNNEANNIYVMGDLFVQGINDTILYAEKIYSRNFTQPSTKFVLSFHYNDDNSYLFVNSKQELKFKTKTESLVKEKLCIGNLSDKWSTSGSEKTGLYRNIYDFVVDYEAIIGVKAIYDMHRYLMIKHNISP